MVPDKLSCGEKPILESNDHIYGACNKFFQRIHKLSGISISPEEVIAFAEANDCFKDVVPLAEHICLVLVKAVEQQQSIILGLEQALRDKIQSVVAVNDSSAFDDLDIPQKDTDPELYSLAVKFLNSKS